MTKLLWDDRIEGGARGSVVVAAAWNGNIETCLMLNKKGFLPMPKDRGAEQGDVDGPQECSLALGMVAAETRGSIAARQAPGALPWIGVSDSAASRPLGQTPGIGKLPAGEPRKTH